MRRTLITAAATAAALAVAGCGASAKLSACASWRTHALSTEQHAWKSAVAQAKSFEAGLPAVSAAHTYALQLADYNVGLNSAELADSKNPKWRDVPKGCTAPAFKPSG